MPIALIPTLAELELVTGGRSSRVADDNAAGCDVIDRSAENALSQGQIKLSGALANMADVCRGGRR